MLPTNERSQIWMGTPALGLRHDQPGSAPFIKYFHLYFLSDEEIDFKKDYVYHVDAAGDRHIIAPNKWIPNPIFCSKIIATTDTYLRLKEIVKEDDSIEFPYITSLPQPSQSFIEKFVEEYNKGSVIKEVMVEYIDEGEEDWFGDDYNGEPFWNEKIVLKINPKDNTITIRKMKDSLNRAELDPILELIREIATDDLDRVSEGIKNKAIERLKWIEENL